MSFMKSVVELGKTAQKHQAAKMQIQSQAQQSGMMMTAIILGLFVCCFLSIIMLSMFSSKLSKKERCKKKDNKIFNSNSKSTIY